MAIVKLPNGKYQAKVQDSASLRWLSKCFQTRREAEVFEAQAKQQLRSGSQLTVARSMTLDDFFEQWRETVQSRASRGWRLSQARTYRKHVAPLLGFRKLESITPPLVARVLNTMAERGLREQTRLHVYMLLRKMFGDAIELFRLLTFNPVSKTLKPRVPLKEARHLNLAQSKALLDHVIEKPYGAAVWVQLFLGLRMGEVQALSWDDVDLTTGIVHIRRTYVRLERSFKDYPKGRRHHSHRIPQELLCFLRNRRAHVASLFVAPGPSGEMLSYEHYHRTLRRYCQELGIPEVGTHGLRHSTSELYLAHGASRDDLRQLFAHSSMAVTERYLHSKGTNLEKVADVIRLFL
jgi:integrase